MNEPRIKPEALAVEQIKMQIGSRSVSTRLESALEDTRNYDFTPAIWGSAAKTSVHL